MSSKQKLEKTWYEKLKQDFDNGETTEDDVISKLKELGISAIKKEEEKEKKKRKEKIYPDLDPLENIRQIIKYKGIDFMCVKHLTQIENPWFFTKLYTVPYHREISIIRKEKIDKFIKIIKNILRIGELDTKTRNTLNNLIKD
jgi:hypothetical protein